MRDLAQELFIFVIFGAVWLAQLLLNHLRRKAAALQAQAQTRAEAQAQVEGESATVLQTTSLRLQADEMLEAVKLTAVPGPFQPPRPATLRRAVPLENPPPRRFSRAALLRDRRAVQDAIVIAAILQPRHAHRPPDVG